MDPARAGPMPVAVAIAGGRGGDESPSSSRGTPRTRIDTSSVTSTAMATVAAVMQAAWNSVFLTLRAWRLAGG